MLKDITVPKKTIEVYDTSFEVQGLTLTDISELLEGHKRALTDVFNGEISLANLVHETPDLAAQIIARAASEKQQVKKALKLPVGVQITALEHIWDLTVPDEETLGKVVARVADAINRFGGEGEMLSLQQAPEDPDTETTGSES